MKHLKCYLLALVAVAGFSPGAFATVDTLQANSYFFTPAGQEFNSPYYRGGTEDWGWTHNAIAGTFTSVDLYISAFDVDAPSEVDNIYAKNNSGAWVLLGSLAGLDSDWGYTDFVLNGGTGASEFGLAINAGLEVKIDIDSVFTTSWIVSLGKSVLTTAGENPGAAIPDGGTSLLLLGSTLLGFASLRRFIR